MAQVYAVVHDGSGSFLIARKVDAAYFFAPTTSDGKGEVKFVPKSLPGGGFPAFPGGALKRVESKDGDEKEKSKDEDPRVGAEREFREETGVNLRDYSGLSEDPAPFQLGSGDDACHGIYFKLGGDELRKLALQVAANLAAGTGAMEWIRAYPRTTYEELAKKFPAMPPDNELLNVAVWTFEKHWERIKVWKDIKGKKDGLDWYYYILLNLKDPTSKDLEEAASGASHRPRRLVSRFARRRLERSRATAVEPTTLSAVMPAQALTPSIPLSRPAHTTPPGEGEAGRDLAETSLPEVGLDGPGEVQG